MTLLVDYVDSQSNAEMPCAIISLSYNTKLFTKFNVVVFYCAKLTHASFVSNALR